jgi:hypothetical protein
MPDAATIMRGLALNWRLAVKGIHSWVVSRGWFIARIAFGEEMQQW